MARWRWSALVGAVGLSMLTACGAGTSQVEVESSAVEPVEPAAVGTASPGSVIGMPLEHFYFVEVIDRQAVVILGAAGAGSLFAAPYGDWIANIAGYEEAELDHAVQRVREGAEPHADDIELARVASHPLYRSFSRASHDDVWMGAWSRERLRFTVGIDIASDVTELAVSNSVRGRTWRVFDVADEICRGVLGPPVLLSMARPNWGLEERLSSEEPTWEEDPAVVGDDDRSVLFRYGHLYLAAPVLGCTVQEPSRVIWARPRDQDSFSVAAMRPLDESDPRGQRAIQHALELPQWQALAQSVREAYFADDAALAEEFPPRLNVRAYSAEHQTEPSERVVMVVYSSIGADVCGDGVAQETMASVWSESPVGADTVTEGAVIFEGTVPVDNFGLTPLLAGDLDSDGNLDLVMQHDAWTGTSVRYEFSGSTVVPVTTVSQANLDHCD